MGHAWFEDVSKYRCLFSSVCLCSPACDPGDGPSEGSTEIDGGGVDWEPVDLGPEFELVSLALALVAVVPSGAEIHRERSASDRGGLVYGTRPTPLIAQAAGGCEVDQLQDLLHGDLVAKLVEIDSWHGRLFFCGWFDGSRTVPFPLIYGERGTVLVGLSRCVANRWSCARSDRLAGATEVRRPGVRS